MGTITLTNPVAGTEIQAGLHATNYSTLQAVINGNLDNANVSTTADLDANARVGIRKNSAGSTFERRRINLIEGSGVTLTVADDSANEEVDVTIAASVPTGVWTEIAYVEFTSTVTATTGTHTEGSPIDIVSAGAITYVANPIIIEFYSPQGSFPGAAEGISLWDSATDLGRLVKAAPSSGPVHVARRITPTAASHTYKIRLWTGDGSSPTVLAGAGGVATAVPGFIRILQRSN